MTRKRGPELSRRAVLAGLGTTAAGLGIASTISSGQNTVTRGRDEQFVFGTTEDLSEYVSDAEGDREDAGAAINDIVSNNDNVLIRCPAPSDGSYYLGTPIDVAGDITLGIEAADPAAHFFVDADSEARALNCMNRFGTSDDPLTGLYISGMPLYNDCSTDPSSTGRGYGRFAFEAAEVVNSPCYGVATEETLYYGIQSTADTGGQQSYFTGNHVVHGREAAEADDRSVGYRAANGTGGILIEDAIVRNTGSHGADLSDAENIDVTNCIFENCGDSQLRASPNSTVETVLARIDGDYRHASDSVGFYTSEAGSSSGSYTVRDSRFEVLTGGDVIVGDYNFENPFRQSGGRIDVERLLNRLLELGINNYFFLIWHRRTDWEDFQEFVPLAEEAGLNVWPYLVPPGETPENVDEDGEPRFGRYSEPYKVDYVRWGEEIATLSNQYSNIPGWAMDDLFYSDDPDRYGDAAMTPEYVDEFTSAAKAINPNLQFIPLLYEQHITADIIANYGSSFDKMFFAYPDTKQEAIDKANLAGGIPLIAMPATFQREYDNRHDDGWSIDNMLDKVNFIIELVNDGTLAGIVTYGTDKTSDSNTFEPLQNAFASVSRSSGDGEERDTAHHAVQLGGQSGASGGGTMDDVAIRQQTDDAAIYADDGLSGDWVVRGSVQASTPLSGPQQERVTINPTGGPVANPPTGDGQYLFASAEQLEATRAAAAAGEAPFAQALQQAINRADARIGGAPIEHNGQRANAEAARDRIRSCAVAYYYTGEDRYAEDAIENLYSFLVDPATSHDPTESAIVAKDRIINSITVPGILFGASLVRDHPHWDTLGGTGQVAQWCDAYFEASKRYSKETWGAEYRMYKFSANRYSYRLLDRFCNAAYMGDDQRFNETLQHFYNVHNAKYSFPDTPSNLIFAHDGAPNGRSRDSGWEYALFDVDAFISCCEVAFNYGVDLYNWQDTPAEEDIVFAAHKGPRDGPLAHRVMRWTNNIFRNPGDFDGVLQDGVRPPNVDNVRRGLTAYEYATGRLPGEVGTETQNVLTEFFPRPSYNRKNTGYPTLTHSSR